MEILILGGTRFIGPHIVERALEEGHKITLFNRGKTDPDRFTELEQLRGDRDAGDYEAIRGRNWDAVVDTSAYVPRAVREALDALDGSFDHYLFISTISVYRDFDAEMIEEDDPLEDPEAVLDDPSTENVDSESYGALKVLCERAARDQVDGRVTILRPGVIAGPGDDFDRFTYWPVRVAEGGRVLAPGRPSRPVQYVDTRDVADAVVTSLEDRITGTFNTVLPPGRARWGSFLETCAEIASADAEFEWIDAATLEQTELEAWGDLPLWAPAESSLRGLAGVSADRAMEEGLHFRDPAETIRDTLAWYRRERSGGREALEAGLSAKTERRVLDEHAE